MAKAYKIVIEINGNIKVITKREFDVLLNSKHPFKIQGTLNEDTTNKITKKQIEQLEIIVKSNINYLANKSPETFLKNFRDSVIRDLKDRLK